MLNISISAKAKSKTTNKSTTKSKSKAKRTISPAQIKKMQAGLKKYREEMNQLREKAAKKAKITTKQYNEYLKALRSPECIAEGRMASVKAAEIANIDDDKFKEFTKLYRKMKQEYKDNKATSKSSFEPSVSVTLSEEKKHQIRQTLKKVYAAIQVLRKKFHNARSEHDRFILRKKLWGFKLHYNKIYSMLHGTPYYHVASDLTSLSADDEEKAAPVVPAPKEPAKTKEADSVPATADETSVQVPHAEISEETAKLLSKEYALADLLNLIQSEKFYEWYVGDFTSWLSGEGKTDEEIVKWADAALSAQP